MTPLGEQRAVAVFPTGHEHAVKPHVGLEQIAPERIVVFPATPIGRFMTLF